MVKSSEIVKKVKELQNIDLDDVLVGKKTGVEENIKLKIVIELLKLLGFDIVKDMDFEHYVKNKRADIAILYEGKPKIMIECKSIEQELDKHIEQALSYAIKKQVKYVILTNGIEIRLYKSFIENITNPSDRLLLKIPLRDLEIHWNELNEWISKGSIISNKLDYLSEEKESVIRTEITAPHLLENLKRAKQLLFENCKPKIEQKYDTEDNFRNVVNKWITASELDITNEQDWLDKLAKEVTYSFINKLYFYRIAEDFGIVKPKLTKDKLPLLIKSVPIKQLINSGFEEILEVDYRAIFQHGLFDKIDFDNNILERVVFQLSEYNFKNISSDILGKIYECHISREERKSLGQFYTPDWIIDFIIKKLPINHKKRILDPACGSGGFLIRVYDKLKKDYEKNGYDKKEIHNLILKKNIFGFDINPFAVQLTATNLVLKDLSNKTDNINIIERDSLSSSLHKWVNNGKANLNGDSVQTNLVDTTPNKYDLIVGNPPYFNLKLEDIKTKYPNESYSTIATGKTNIASLFLKKYIDCLEDGGYLGFVVPKSLTYVEPWKPTRKFILENCQIISIFDLRQAFEDVKLEEIVIIVKKTKEKNSNNEVDVHYMFYEDSSLIEQKHKVKLSLFTDDYYPLYLDEINQNIKETSLKESSLLGDFTDITRGVYLQQYPQVLTDKKTTQEDLKIMAGKDIGRFVYRGNKFVNLKNRKVEEFNSKIKRVLVERVVSQRIVAQTRNHIKIIATYDKGNNLNVDTVINIIPKNGDFKVKFLLGILNSKFASYYLYNFVYNRAVRSMNFEYVKYLPIKNTPISEQSKIVDLVDKLLRLNQEITILEKVKKKEDINKLKKTVKEVEQQLDKEVYSIYCLSKTEIKTIEELE